MTEREKIEESLRKKEKEIRGLEEKLKATKVYVKALRDILSMLDKGTDAEAAESTLRQGSAVAQARDVILAYGTPVYISQLLDAMKKPPTREARSSLTSSLAAYVRRGEIFVRTSPNTFGLIELGHDSEEAGIESEPPAGFGQLPPTTLPPLDPDLDDENPF